MTGLKIKELWRNCLENSLREIKDNEDYVVNDSSTFEPVEDEGRLLKCLMRRCKIGVNNDLGSLII